MRNSLLPQCGALLPEGVKPYFIELMRMKNIQYREKGNNDPL